MRRLLSGLLLLNLLYACGEKLPEGIVPKSKMPALMLDVHLTDSELSSKPIDSARMLFNSSYEAVFERHGIDSATFNRTIQYYSTRPTEFKAIYAEVAQHIDRSIKADEAIRAEEYRQRLVADSLAAVQKRDSLYWLSRDSVEVRRLRHLLLVHEADSTVDPPVPFTFRTYSQRLFENLGVDTARNPVPALDFDLIPVVPESPTPMQMRPAPDMLIKQ